jgi:hypothetical protein
MMKIFTMAEQNFVFNGIEVKLTGRRAQKTLRNNTEILFEIQPADPDEGCWKRWVRQVELYEIQENNNE